MNFYHEWNENLNEMSYMIKFLSKVDESREVFRTGTEIEVKFACDVLRKIRMESYLEAIKLIDTNRQPKTDEIPQCGTLEKAICEVPQALAFAPNGLICEELGLKLGAENHGDAPRKSGEGNGKLADAMDIAIRMKLPAESKRGTKYGYKISALGKYLLRYDELEDKMDVVSRLLIREYVMQVLFLKAADGYASYNDAVSSLKSPATRMRRRQNVRRIAYFIDSEVQDGPHYLEYIDWEVKDIK